MAPENEESRRELSSWQTDFKDVSLPPINWKALVDYAIDVKRKHSNNDCKVTCQISDEYKKGGLNIVRRLKFHDDTCWLVRLQLHKATPESLLRLEQEVHTIQVIRERSNIRVPEVFAYESNCSNAVGAGFTITDFIPADTAMDSSGGWPIHKGIAPPRFKWTFYTDMAGIQVSLESFLDFKYLFSYRSKSLQ